MTKILTENDPRPFEIYNGESDSPYIITVEHASNLIPIALNDMGLNQQDLESHIAYDPYTKQFSLDIANELGCAVITSKYSRLVIDCNRIENSHQLIRDESDGVIIPANKNLSDNDIKMRMDEIYTPYHDAIRLVSEKHNKPYAFISMHSFTPQLNSDKINRPWDVGFMWDHDDELAVRFHDFFKENYPYIRVGLNVPYDARIEEKGSMHIHAWPFDIPAVEVELNFGTMADTNKYQCILSGFIEFMKEEIV
jgi:predicted N-formylglutamate amidohydrolase